MIFSGKIVKPWKGRDYSRSIFHFVLHTIILAILFLGAICLNEGGISGLTNYFRDTQLQFVYLMILTGALVTMFYLYLYFEYRNFLREGKNIFMLFLILYLALITNFLIGKYLHVYARPLAFCALLVLLLVNRKVAIMTNIVFCLLLFMVDVFTTSSTSADVVITSNTSLESVVYSINASIFFSMFIGITTGLLAIYMVSSVTSRIKVFFMGIVISFPIIACILAIELLLMFGMDKINIDMNKVWIYICYGLTSGMLSVVLMMATLPFFEQGFNVLTDYRLSEITDHKSKLIKELRDKAAGTFNHSVMISTLAEACASAIGENPLLARAAAYYHDIGKLKQPLYFTENQSGVNPHNELSPELSTDIIRAHARDGYELIRKYHLPQILADIALEHHGTLPIKYFYAKALKYTDGELDANEFSYPGPRPQSKISAIIMICDASEAASRSIADRSAKNVEQQVRNIIEERMNLEQLNECELTMLDIDIIRNTIIQSLAGVYHDRVAYPKVKIKQVRRQLPEKNEEDK